MDEKEILAIERPSPRLLVYYVLRSILFPLRLIALPYDFFRYQTMQYRFDADGVSMSWGVLFRREIHLTYARVQDIHLTSGLLQRWLGLGDLQIQTASGSAGAEMTIEGILAVESLRDFLYERMRGAREGRTPQKSALEHALGEVASELRRTREALERLAVKGTS
jgi:putative membrane protein